MIALKLSDNGNDINVGIAEVDGDTETSAYIAEENCGIGLVSNLNLVGTNISNSNNGTISESFVEEGLQT